MPDFAEVAGAALDRLEAHAPGLDATDRRYVRMIADVRRGGPVSVEPRDTIEEAIEPYLVQLGLVARTARGRMLNAGGWRHLALQAPAGARMGCSTAGGHARRVLAPPEILRAWT